MEEVRCSHLDAVFDNWKAMNRIAHRLSSLGNSFEDVGNEKVASVLYNISEEVMFWAGRIRDTHGERQSQDLARTHEATANILSAFIIGVETKGVKK